MAELLSLFPLISYDPLSILLALPGAALSEVEPGKALLLPIHSPDMGPLRKLPKYWVGLGATRPAKQDAGVGCYNARTPPLDISLVIPSCGAEVVDRVE